MNWGNSLLSTGLFNVDLKGAFSDIAYGIGKIFHYVLLAIWTLIAHVVNAIEGVFRNLAGLDVPDGNDMVSEIIYHDTVGAIFKNMVGLATAVIIFFTILKIIQEHYKEKDGGNPYKIVLRTFKGLLMFFFVQAAVVVGLKASQVMFRALDAATGGGSASVAGQVFKSMAYDANRKRVGRDGRGGLKSYAMNQYYSRMDDSTVDTKDGKYFVLEMTGDPVSGASVSKQTLVDLFPAYGYGIVNSDGSVTPLAKWAGNKNISTAAEGDEGEGFWDEFFVGDVTDGFDDDDYDISDGTMNGSVGYKNEILRGFDLTVTPSISLAWSPFDIWNYEYKMQHDHAIPHSFTINLFGFSETIDMSTEFVRYQMTADDKKSMEDSAKQLGISLNGQISLQGGEANASFSLEMFKPEHFLKIFSAAIMNMGYTTLTKRIIEAIPALPGSTSIGALNIDYMQLIAPIVMKGIEKMNFVVMKDLIPLDDEEGSLTGTPGAPIVQSLVVDPDSYTGNIWVEINSQSSQLPVTIEMYELDMNFRDLHGQLIDNFKALLHQITQGQEAGWQVGQEMNRDLQDIANKVGEGKEWIVYKELVDQYNKKAVSFLTRLSENLALYDAIARGNNDFDIVNYEKSGTSDPNYCNGVNEWLYQQNFPGTVDDLITTIKSNFLNLVSGYNGYLSPVFSQTNYMPMDSYADAMITPALYKPIIEFKMSDNVAYNLTVPEIIAALMNESAKKTGEITVNMAIEEKAGKYDGYRMIDWRSYGGVYNSTFGDYIDLYHEDKYVPIDKSSTTEYFYERNVNEPRFNSNGKQSVLYADLSKWGFFLNPPVTYTKNPFAAAMNPTSGNKKMTFAEGHWGRGGITLGNGNLVGSDGNVKSHRYYQSYNSTALDVLNSNNMWAPHNAWLEPQDGTQTPNTAAVEEVSQGPVVVASTASANQSLSQAKSDFSAQLAKIDGEVDTSSALANEFSKKILTFRDLTTADSQKREDKKILEDWLAKKPSVRTLSSYRAKELYNMTPEEVDDLMMTGANARRYLMITKDGTTVATEENMGDYIAKFSCLNLAAVDELYDLFSINFVIGYIGIISALGVYLNFVFGLIQRAVNMSVIYMLSPISIAFYPFDDGQKFNSNFVSQFYKEAISAFSIIISLNIFIVLLEPVQNAVESVTGSAALAWLGLVAFTSMLTKIRDTISSLLGASSIQSKGVGAMFDDAHKARHAARESFKGGLLGRGIKKAQWVRGLANQIAPHKKKRDQEIAANLRKLDADGKLSPLGKLRLEKLENDKTWAGFIKRRASEKINSKRSASQGRILGAHMATKEKGSLLTDEELKKRGLSKGEIKQYRNQQEAAVRAQQSGKGDKYELLSDPNFAKSINSTVKTKKASAGARGNIMKTALRYSLAGEIFANTFGKFSANAKKDGTILNEFWKWTRADLREADQNKIIDEETGYIKKKNDVAQDAEAGGSLLAQKENEAAVLAKNFAQSEARRQAVASLVAGMSPEERFKHLYAAQNAEELLKNDKENKLTPEAAKTLAQTNANNKWNEINGNNDKLKQEMEKLSGGNLDSIESRLSAMVSQDPSKFGIDFNSKENMEKAAEIERFTRVLMENNEVFALEQKKNGDEGMRAEAVDQIAAQLASKFGINPDTDKEKYDQLKKNILDAGSKENMFDRIASTLGVDKNEAKTSLKEANELLNKLDDLKQQIQMTNTAIAGRKLQDQGRKMLKDKLGDGVSAHVVNAYIEAARNANADLASANINSVGYKLNQYKQQCEADGKQMDEAFVNQIKNEAVHNLQKAFDGVMRHAGEIREYKMAKKYRDNYDSSASVAVITEKANQREFHMTMKMNTDSIALVHKDNLINTMHRDGNYMMSGILLQELVDAIREGNRAKAESLEHNGKHFDDETINKMFEWQQSGKESDQKLLDGIRGLGVFDATNLGSVLNDMTGTGLENMQATAARLFNIGEIKAIQEKVQLTMDNYSREEQKALDEISNAIADAKNFNNHQFDSLINKIKDMNGNTVNSVAELSSCLSSILTAGKSNPNVVDSSFVKENVSALQDFIAADENKNNKYLIDNVQNWLDALNKVQPAHTASRNKDGEQTYYNELTAQINEQMKKLTGAGIPKPSGGN